MVRGKSRSHIEQTEREKKDREQRYPRQGRWLFLLLLLFLGLFCLKAPQSFGLTLLLLHPTPVEGENILFSWLPLLRYEEEGQKAKEGRTDPSYSQYLELVSLYEELSIKNGMDEQSKGEIGEEPTTKGELAAKVDEEEGKEATQTQLPQNENAFSLPYSQEQLADYDFLIQKVYNVHSSTTAPREVMNAETFLEKDFSLEQGGEEPQILIYHSHSQETYLEEGAGEDGASVVALGKVLSACLEERGYRVLHDSTVYDLRDGKLDRSKAYTYALEGILGILTQHPSIEVVIDLHRDGVPENVHLVSEIDGKQTAQLMFFNGMSQTPSGPIAYLENPYREDNLAFSFQLQMAAMSRYPGLTRKIFLKGLRYNLHVRPRSLLIEVGAQNNSFEEAQNAMEPLADILAQVLAGT